MSPAVQDLLGFTPTELFNQPLATVLHPECHATFEAHVQRIMEIQFKRPLQGAELCSTFTFRSRAGAPVPLDGVGQAWQRGKSVEFVMSFRARHAATTHAQPAGAGMVMVGSQGSQVPPLMPPQQSGFVGHSGASVLVQPQAQVGSMHPASLMPTTSLPQGQPHVSSAVLQAPMSGLAPTMPAGGVSAPPMAVAATLGMPPSSGWGHAPMAANAQMPIASGAPMYPTSLPQASPPGHSG